MHGHTDSGFQFPSEECTSFENSWWPPSDSVTKIKISTSLKLVAYCLKIMHSKVKLPAANGTGTPSTTINYRGALVQQYTSTSTFIPTVESLKIKLNFIGINFILASFGIRIWRRPDFTCTTINSPLIGYRIKESFTVPVARGISNILRTMTTVLSSSFRRRPFIMVFN